MLEVVKFLQAVDMVSKGKSIESIVLKHGENFAPAPLPEGIGFGTESQCFNNAWELMMLQRGRLHYVEGYANTGHFVPVHHAWCVDDTGNVWDNTWKDVGVEYFGILLDKDFVNSVILETEESGCLKGHSKVFRDRFVNGGTNGKEKASEEKEEKD